MRRSLPSSRAWSPVLVTTLVALTLLGCHATVLNPTPADPWRREIAEKDRKIASLEARVGELETALAERSATPAPEGSEAAVVPAGAVPHVAGIRLARQTGVDPDSRGTIRVWVEPFDGRERFIQMAGTLVIEVSVPDPSGPDGRRTVCETFGPLAVRDAWRSGVMGASYAFALHLPEGVVVPVGSEGEVRATATLALLPSGRRLEASWPPPAQP